MRGAWQGVFIRAICSFAFVAVAGRVHSQECRPLPDPPVTLYEAGRYCLDRDISWAGAGTAYALGPNVRIDLQGHTVRSTVRSVSTIAFVGSGAGISVENGTIEAFHTAAALNGPDVGLAGLRAVRSGYLGLIAHGDRAVLRDNFVLETGVASGYPQQCSNCTVSIGISGAGAGIVVSGNVVLDSQPVIESVGIAVRDAPDGLVSDNIVNNSERLPLTFGAWYNGVTSRIETRRNWFGKVDTAFVYSDLSGSYEDNTYFDIGQVLIFATFYAPASELHNLGGNRHVTAGGALPVLSIVPLGISESQTAAVVQLRLSEAPRNRVDVSWRTLDGTAIGGSDFVPSSGVATFHPGERFRTVQVPLIDDGVAETDEDFYIRIDDVAGAEGASDGRVTLFDRGCSVPVLSSLAFPRAGGTVGVTGSGGCESSRVASETWISTADIPGSGFSVTVPAHAGSADQTGRLDFPGGSAEVRQAGYGPPVAPADVTADESSLRVLPRIGWSHALRADEYVVEVRDVHNGLVFQAAALAADACVATREPSECFIDVSFTGAIALARQPISARVRSRNDAGLGAWSEWVSVPLAVPETTGLRAGTLGSTLAFQWRGLAGATSYRVWLQDVSGQVVVDAWADPSHCSGLVCEYAAPPLTAAGYSWWVQARSGTAYSAWSDRDDVALPTLSIAPAATSEGDSATTTASATIRLSSAVPWPVTVAWETRDGVATAASDYVTSSGTAFFTPGQTEAIVSAQVEGDLTYEPDESFDFVLSTPVGGRFASSIATFTILNDDPNPITLSLSPSMPAPSANATVSLAGGPGHPRDWVGLFRPAAAGGALIGWWYLNGQRIAPSLGSTTATFPIVLPAVTGPYELRFFHNDGFAAQATQPFEVAEPASLTVLSVLPTTPAPGAMMSVGVTSGPGNPRDWVGLYRVGGAASLVRWWYLNGQTTPPSFGLSSTTFTVTAPTVEGDYEIRFYSDDTFVAAKAFAFEVRQPASSALLSIDPLDPTPGSLASVTLTGGPGNARDWVGLFDAGAPDTSLQGWWYLNGSRTPPSVGLPDAGFSIIAPLRPGNYEIRLFRNDTFERVVNKAFQVDLLTPVLTVPPVVVAAQPMTVQVTGDPGDPSDWVGVYRPGDGDTQMLAWFYLNGSHTAPANGSTSATLVLQAPPTPGQYEVRLFASDGFVRLVTAAFTVDP